MPKVSVIMPCYNQGPYIHEAVNSVLEQSFKDIEIIIVNDGSTDPFTNDLLKNFSARGVTIYSTENRGVSAARNLGIEKCGGEYILPLDSDDRISGNYINDALTKLINNPALKLVYCEGQYFGEEEGIINLPPFTVKGMLKQNLVFCTAMFRKADWKASGGYDEAFLTGWEDWEFWLRLIDNESQVYKLTELGFHYRIKQNSRNADIINLNLQLAEQQLLKKHWKLYLSYYPRPIGLIREYEFLQNEVTQFEEYKKQLSNSFSYRLGSFILSPVKALTNKWKAGQQKNHLR